MSGIPPPDPLELAILTLLIDRHPAPVHRDELARGFADDDWPATVESLLADGLIHREGDLYLVSRAATRVVELLG
jgi:hypothetical protein